MSSLAHHKASIAGSSFWKRPDALSWQDIEKDTGERQRHVVNIEPFECVFHAGDEKTVFYRIDAGVVSLSRRAADGSLRGFRLAFPGEFIGLGTLLTHVNSARALIASTVTLFPNDEIEELVENDLAFKALLEEANRREADDVATASQAAKLDVERA